MKQRGRPEYDFQRLVIGIAQRAGWKVGHFRGVRVLHKDGSTNWQTPVDADGAGFPDTLMLRGHERLVAELKVGHNKPSPAQKAWLQAFEIAGIPAFTWTPNDMAEITKVLIEGPDK